MARPHGITPIAALFAAVLTVGVCERVEATNGLKLTAYGARAAGRGGVDYAFSDDAIGPVNNPAGMAFVYGNRFDNNWAAVDATVEWSNVYGTQSDRDNLFFAVPAFSFGVFIDPEKDWEIAPIFDMGSWGLFDEEEEGEGEAEPDLESEFESGETSDYSELGSRVRIGLGIFPVTGGRVQMKDLRIPLDPAATVPTTPEAYAPGTLDWETDILTVALTPSIAFRINDNFSIGLNLQVIYSKFELDGGIAQPPELALTTPFFVAGIFAAGRPHVLNNSDMDDVTTWGFSARLGLMFNSKYFSAGLVYQEKGHVADYLGRVTVNAEDEIARLGGAGALSAVDPGINGALGFVSEYDLRIQDFETPRMVGLGIAIRPHRRFSIGIDYTYIHWTEVARVFKARLSGGDNPNLDIIAGPSVHVHVPVGWDNQHVIAIGATVLAFEGDDLVEGVPSWALVLRAGWNYGKNPTPGETTLPQQPTIAEHHVYGGFTVHWGPLVEINFAFEWALPSNLKTGPNSASDFTLSNSEQDLELMIYHFGLGFNF